MKKFYVCALVGVLIECLLICYISVDMLHETQPHSDRRLGRGLLSFKCIITFRIYRKFAKSDYLLRHMSLCQSARNDLARTERILIKFGF